MNKIAYWLLVYLQAPFKMLVLTSQMWKTLPECFPVVPSFRLWLFRWWLFQLQCQYFGMVFLWMWGQLPPQLSFSTAAGLPYLKGFWMMHIFWTLCPLRLFIYGIRTNAVWVLHLIVCLQWNQCSYKGVVTLLRISLLFTTSNYVKKLWWLAICTALTDVSGCRLN